MINLCVYCDMDNTGALVVPPLLSSKISANREARYESNMQKYVVPALRHKKIMCATEQRGILGVKPVPYDTLVPHEEVKPTFRTPCQYFNVASRMKV